ncbi:MAG: hypothetical protein HYX66_04860 [Ignavibacteria bacterium]|nr:hypothetical protein [Ignavibacteria bacterium]
MIAAIIIILQIVTGFGILAQCRFLSMRAAIIPLAFLVGSFVHSMLFFTADIFSIGLSQSSMIVTAGLCAVISHLRLRPVIEFYNYLVLFPKFTLQMHDVVSIVIASGLAYYVVWAAWYWPVTPFDAMAGIDLVARQTVEEGTIANRVFFESSLTSNLSNQPFYAPYAMLMQVMYRLMGFTFGQLWVSFVAIAFSWIVWIALRQVCHAFIANVLWFFFLLTPEILGYTYLLQTDYANAAFFSTGVLMLVAGLRSDSKAHFTVSAFLFSAACWSRSETIAIVMAGVIASIPLFRKAMAWREVFLQSGKVIGASLISFLLWSAYYVPFRLPIQPDLSWELKGNALQRLLQVIPDTFQHVIINTHLWGWAFILFVIMFGISWITTRTPGRMALLLWIAVTLLCLVVISSVFQSAIVELTLRRGIFKIIPLIIILIGSLPLIRIWSERLRQWEFGA